MFLFSGMYGLGHIYFHDHPASYFGRNDILMAISNGKASLDPLDDDTVANMIASLEVILLSLIFNSLYPLPPSFWRTHLSNDSSLPGLNSSEECLIVDILFLCKASLETVSLLESEFAWYPINHS